MSDWINQNKLVVVLVVVLGVATMYVWKTGFSLVRRDDGYHPQPLVPPSTAPMPPGPPMMPQPQPQNLTESQWRSTFESERRQ